MQVMANTPPEVLATADIHSDLLLCAHVAFEIESDRRHSAAHPALELRARMVFGQQVSLRLMNELVPRLGARVEWFESSGFVAMLHRESGVALRLGRCDDEGRPNIGGERGCESLFTKFLKGERPLFDGCTWTPLFGGYSLARAGDGEMVVDRFVLTRYEDKEPQWAWGIEPGEGVQALHDFADDPSRSLPTQLSRLPVQRQHRIA